MYRSTSWRMKIFRRRYKFNCDKMCWIMPQGAQTCTLRSISALEALLPASIIDPTPLSETYDGLVVIAFAAWRDIISHTASNVKKLNYTETYISPPELTITTSNVHQLLISSFFSFFLRGQTDRNRLAHKQTAVKTIGLPTWRSIGGTRVSNCTLILTACS